MVSAVPNVREKQSLAQWPKILFAVRDCTHGQKWWKKERKIRKIITCQKRR